MRIFVSYASEDLSTAEAIALALAGRQHNVFFDRESLPAGGNYHERIREAIESSDLIVFLISSQSVASGGYAQTELELTQARWAHPQHHVLPVRLDHVEWDKIPAYLKAVTVLEPKGNIEAEVLAAVIALEPILESSTPASPRAAGAKPSKRRKKQGSQRSNALLVAVVAAVGTIIAALITIAPHYIRPVTPPPSKWSASIDKCLVESTPMTVKEYLARRETKEVAAKKERNYTASQLQYQGRVFYYRVSFVGPPKERYAMYFQMFDADTNKRIRIDDDEDEPFATLFQEVAEDSFDDFQWFEPANVVTDPKQKLRVRLELRNIRHNQPMAHCETTPFDLS